jgi:hypothetical protein
MFRKSGHRLPSTTLSCFSRAQRVRPRSRGASAAFALILLFAGNLAPSPVLAVLIASGDGTGNVTAPVDDPGFANVGILNGLCAVYLGNGWVVTAHHVGAGPVTFGGVDYPNVPGSYTRLTGPGAVPPDVAVMKIVGDPGIPAPVIATSPPPGNADIVMIGRGSARGAPLTWMGLEGWQWAYPFTIRWGTNKIKTTGILLADTRAMEVEFDKLGQGNSTTHEAQAALGDSGGALFWKSGSQWRLAGTLFLSLAFNGQPAQTALYTNLTGAVDLSYYRTQILTYVNKPACNDGLDDDLDGLVDYPADPGCDSLTDASERSPALECDDGLDNDLDGAIDHPADPQCLSPTTPFEAPPVPISALWGIGALAGSLGVVGLRHAHPVGGSLRRVDQSSSRTR